MSENIFHWIVVVGLFLILLQLSSISNNLARLQNSMETAIDNVLTKISSLNAEVEVSGMNIESINEKLIGVSEQFPSQKEIEKRLSNEP